MSDEIDHWRQRAEQLARENARLERLIDAAAAGQDIELYGIQSVLYVEPATQRIVDANNAALDFLGYPREHLLRLTIPEIEVLNASGDSSEKTVIERKVEITIYLCAYRHAQGHLLPVEVRRLLISGKHDPILHYSLEDTTLPKRVWRELNRRGDTAFTFQQRLKALNELTLELSRIDSYDALCQQIVRLGIERLGFDRLGLWFYDPELGLMVGSYGVDEQGQMRDERDQRWRASNSQEIGQFLAGNTQVALVFDEGPVYNHKSEVVDYGWHIAVPLLHGDRFIGVLSADNYLRKQVMKEYEPELLRLYGITVAHLTELIRTRDQTFALRLQDERAHMLRAFITNVGHDFRTPLSVINTKSFLIQRAQTVEQREALVGGIHQQVSYIGHMLDGMLELVALQSELTLTTALVDLRRLVMEVVTGYQALLAAKGLTCALDDAHAMTISADPRLLRRAVRALFENAMQYTPAGGSIQVSFARYANEIGIRIRDTGVGIAQEHLGHIFEPLFRVDQARTERRSGLGLAIARTIVEAHGGRITVESAPGVGSTFEVIVPVD
jgi:signal transduction histidine kinase